jgi:hypothetical protein
MPQAKKNRNAFGFLKHSDLCMNRVRAQATEFICRREAGRDEEKMRELLAATVTLSSAQMIDSAENFPNYSRRVAILAQRA